MSTTQSKYTPTAVKVDGVWVWQVRTRINPLTGLTGETIVWQGDTGSAMRKALAEFRERERFDNAHRPTA